MVLRGMNDCPTSYLGSVLCSVRAPWIALRTCSHVRTIARWQLSLSPMLVPTGRLGHICQGPISVDSQARAIAFFSLWLASWLSPYRQISEGRALHFQLPPTQRVTTLFLRARHAAVNRGGRDIVQRSQARLPKAMHCTSVCVCLASRAVGPHVRTQASSADAGVPCRRSNEGPLALTPRPRPPVSSRLRIACGFSSADRLASGCGRATDSAVDRPDLGVLDAERVRAFSGQLGASFILRVACKHALGRES